MLEKDSIGKGLDTQLYNNYVNNTFDESDFPSEIRLIPISTGARLDQLCNVVYESDNKKSSGYNFLNLKCYNNINRARYAFLKTA